MTPADRAALIARAKQLAVPVVSCVAASLRPDHLRREMSADEMWALVIVLAEAADPARLREIVKAADDGTPDPSGRAAMLARAHAECDRLRRAAQPVPLRLRVLDSEYQAARRKASPPKPAPRPEGLMAGIRYDERAGRRAA
jgi:hypothetical protein